MIAARPALLLFGAWLACAHLPTALAAEAALEGVAWEQADQAFRSYQSGRYRDALQQVDAALKLRPDVARLNLLKVYTLQKLGRRNEARQAAQSALKRGVRDPGLQAAVTNLQHSAPAASGPAPSAAYQRGFPLATKAYAAYNAGDMAAAERDGERAFRTDPSQGAWALLWLDSLEAQQRWAEAATAAGTAISLGAPNSSDLEARRQTLNRRMAVRPAEQAYQALIANRPGDAVPLAREAVRLAPDIASHRLLLVTVLLLDNQPAAAEQAANDALEADDESTVMRVMRGYLRQYQGNAQAADSDFDSALAQDWLDEEQLRNVRLIAIDAALAGGDKARATALLAPMDASDEAVGKRQQALADGRAPATTLNLSNYPAPRQSCQDTPYGTQCELLPADAGGAAGPASEAYAAYARQDYQAAIQQARKAVEQDPDNLEFQRLLTTALAAGNPQQAAEAEQRLSDAIARAPSDAELLMQRGYLRMRTAQPARAREDFRAARDTGKAPNTVVLDEAYALSAMGEKPAAVRQLKHAIDMDDAGTLQLDAQQRHNTRSAIDDEAVLRQLKNSGKDVFYRTDQHWTQAAADATALATAEQARRDVPALKGTAGSGMQLGSEFKERRYGDLAERFLTPEQRKQTGRETFTVRRQAAANGLLDDAPAPLHVTGHSMVQPYFGFPQKLSNSIDRPVSVNWKPGNVGQWIMLLEYLESADFKRNPPQVLVWQMFEPTYAQGPQASGLWDNASIMSADSWRQRLRAAAGK